MKKYIITISLVLGALAYGQIQVQNTPTNTIGNQNPFLDASMFNGFSNNIGKGLYFPTTDLTTWEFKTNGINPSKFKNYYDGMIVYNSTSGQTIEDTTKGGKRVKVEPGFYYFKNPNQVFPKGSVENGEWIRLNDSFASNQEWKYNPTNQRIELVRSGKNEFKNKVYYTGEGGLKSYDFESYGNRDVNNYFSVDWKRTSNINTIIPDNYYKSKLSKSYKSNFIVADEDENDRLIVGISSSLSTDLNKATDYFRLTTNSFEVSHLGSGNVSYMRGGNFYSNIANGSSKGLITGLESLANASGNVKNINRINAFEGWTQIKSGTNINRVEGISSKVVYSNANNVTIGETRVIDAGYYFYNTANLEVPVLIGFKYGGFKEHSQVNISKHYGIYLDDVVGATNRNYAIYTKAGDIRFGQFKEENAPAERLLAVDADGKLLVSGSSANFASLWANDATNNLIKLKNLADGTTARTDSGDDRNSVTIDNAGAITAKAFFGYNGAKIYPDYVFQKYYTGKSDIKANYTFNTLNEVEDFVKTNGHLPGYQLAKEVKAQGYIDVLSTQLTNVEKIEELYLHTIEQEKEMKAQKQQIKAQQKQIEELKTMVQQLLNK